ncbi:MAG: endoribonuclease MazF [Thermoanaerobacteraceae bacterium]|nr:endoribonuclease MazF [Thermoanaerobacteraceae bacterium]
MVASGIYVPERGDIIWLQFDPQAGHEQAGKRPALVISPEPYNKKVGLALMCPITSKTKGYPFEVLLPADLTVSGVVLADQVKSLDWQARRAQFACKAPAEAVADVIAKILVLISP